MSNSRATMESALRVLWVERLHLKEFAGSPWHFLRYRDDFVDSVSVEWKKDECRVILGVEPKSFPSALRDKIPDFTQLPPHEWQFQDYVRPENGYWFRFEGLSSDDAQILAQVIDDCVDESAESFFSNFETIEQLASHSPEDLSTSGQLLEWFEGNQRIAALFFCNLHMFRGDVNRAKEFAHFGSSLRKGTVGQQQMRDILAM